MRFVKLHPNKIINIVFIIFIFIIAIISININDNLKSTREELIKFYETPLDSCLITKLKKIKYPTRGDYTVFYTSCSDNYFPLLLQRNISLDDVSDIFKENVLIIKEINSLELILIDDGTIHNVEIRDPNNEDDRKFGTAISLIFIGISILIIILLPNSLYDKMWS